MVSDQGPAPKEGDVGTVLSVNISARKGTRKKPAECGYIELVADYGVGDDAHAGDWHRQVSFLAEESIQVARDHGLDEEEQEGAGEDRGDEQPARGPRAGLRRPVVDCILHRFRPPRRCAAIRLADG